VPKAFFDTNVLIYQMDRQNLTKRGKCRNLVRRAVEAGDAVISTQVLQEFYIVSTKKLGMKALQAKSLIHAFNNMEVVTINTDLIDEAIDISVQYRLSFWDSLIIAAAESARCALLYTEDLNPGQIIRGMKITDPME
jgi:predicted nucleic acid-binding protein